MDSVVRRPALVAALLAAALVAWIVTAQRMRGMDAGPGTDLGAFGWFMGIWVTMMAAMMLPSALPTVAMFAGVRPGAPAWAFVVGYLLAWATVGLAAYGAYRALRELAPGVTAWDERGAWVAGAALIVAGVYQLTPLKTACLRHCRAPLGFLLRGGPGRTGAIRTGLGHGAYCIGCCAGLMLALFALGVMSLVWMTAVAAVILVEKVLPRGLAFARAAAVGLVVAGVWVAVAPGSVPGLTDPAGTGMTPMRMEESP
jgi:predicted metal-binding membrane protein